MLLLGLIQRSQSRIICLINAVTLNYAVTSNINAKFIGEINNLIKKNFSYLIARALHTL